MIRKVAALTTWANDSLFKYQSNDFITPSYWYLYSAKNRNLNHIRTLIQSRIAIPLPLSSSVVGQISVTSPDEGDWADRK